jgi:hypothetical protein
MDTIFNSFKQLHLNEEEKIFIINRLLNDYQYNKSSNHFEDFDHNLQSHSKYLDYIKPTEEYKFQKDLTTDYYSNTDSDIDDYKLFEDNNPFITKSNYSDDKKLQKDDKSIIDLKYHPNIKKKFIKKRKSNSGNKIDEEFYKKNIKNGNSPQRSVSPSKGRNRIVKMENNDFLLMLKHFDNIQKRGSLNKEEKRFLNRIKKLNTNKNKQCIHFKNCKIWNCLFLHSSYRKEECFCENKFCKELHRHQALCRDPNHEEGCNMIHSFKH